MSPTGTKVTIKQRGWLGAFEMRVNGELLGEVISIHYATGVDEPPIVTVAFLADPVEIELTDAVVEILRGEYGEPGREDKNDLSTPRGGYTPRATDQTPEPPQGGTGVVRP